MPKIMVVLGAVPDDSPPLQPKGILVAPKQAGALVGMDRVIAARLAGPHEVVKLFADLCRRGLIEVPVRTETGEESWQPIKSLTVRVRVAPPVSPIIQSH